MMVSDPSFPARQTIAGALSRIERRLRLNRTLHQAVLLAGLALAVALTVQALRWLGEGRPVASALLVLVAILAVVALLCLLLASALRQRADPGRAAAEADARAHLFDELASAWWFMREAAGSDFAGAQVERAARTALSLQPARLVPVRIGAPALVALAVAAIALAALWSAAPLAPARALAAQADALSPAEQERVRALRALAAALPDGEVARKLEQALATLERADSSPGERSRALAQAQGAVEQLRLEGAATRESLQRAAEMLRDQPGMQAVAEALARGDPQGAADLLAKMQERVAQAGSDQPPASEPAAGGGPDKSLEQALLEASEATGPQPAPMSPDAVQQAVERLAEIARELAAANYVNEAWEKVRGAQLDVAQANALTASRFAEDTTGNVQASPATGDSPLRGGAMFSTAAVGQGDGRTEQEGGARSGEALGDAPPEALHGAPGERLETQLKQAGLSGPEAQSEQNDAWFYAPSREQKALAGWRNVQGSSRSAQAQAGSEAGISIQHRQIVKDYFMTLREGPSR